MFTLKMDGDIEELKNYLSRCIRNDDNEINFVFAEGRTNGEFNIELVQFYLDKIKEFFPNREFNYSIEYQIDTSKVLNADKCKELEKIDNLFRDKFNKELVISQKDHAFSYGFRDTLNANRKLDDVANKIKNATNDGQPLSPFEKFMLAYEYVTDFIYNEDKVNPNESRNWVPVMNGDKIVCVGYASLLKELCTRIFPNQEVKVACQGLSVYDNKGNFLGGHENNLVCIKDEKYKIDGIFYCDSCWDSVKYENENKHHLYCCIPLQDTLHMKNYEFKFRYDITDLYLQQFDEYLKEYDDLPKQTESILLRNVEFEDKLSFFEINNFTIHKYETNRRTKPRLEDKKTTSSIHLIRQTILEKDEFETKLGNFMKKYSDLRIPNMGKTKLEELGITKLLAKLKNTDINDQVYIEIVEKLAEIFSSKEMKDYIPKKGEFIQEFPYYIKDIYKRSKKKLLEEKEIEKEIISLRNENAKNFFEALNKRTSSSIPIEAFINHFKFLGTKKGLKGKELDEFVKIKLNNEIEEHQKYYDSKKCMGCFATQQILKTDKITKT